MTRKKRDARDEQTVHMTGHETGLHCRRISFGSPYRKDSVSEDGVIIEEHYSIPHGNLPVSNVAVG
jgi:hypothetical protein